MILDCYHAHYLLLASFACLHVIQLAAFHSILYHPKVLHCIQQKATLPAVTTWYHFVGSPPGVKTNSWSSGMM
jgi:hypothetical protein